MSNTKISLLSQIHDKEMSWNAKVVVSRIWHYRGGSDDGPIVHTDIVVLDQEGTHMYGQIPPGPAENLKDILEEGKVYLIKRFMCKQSKQTYRAVESPYMMQLLGLLPCFLSRVLKKTTHTALQPRVLFGYSSARPKHLLLSRGNEIRLVLWGARSREFDAEEVRAASNVGAVIAIFVGTLPKMYRGVKGLSGSSACRWYIDEDLPEMNAFRARHCFQIVRLIAISRD